MTEFISNLIGNEYIATVIVSLFPLIELKGGIVYAQSAGINFVLSFLLAYLGSTIVYILVYFLVKPVLALLKKIQWVKGFAERVEYYFEKKANNALEERKNKNKKIKNQNFLKAMAVSVFVAIPLPMTGVYAGTILAVFLGLSFVETVLPVAIGNFIAGVLILILSAVCKALNVDLDLVLYVLLGIGIILLSATIIKIAVGKKKKEGEKAE
jgi:uncharacterized membrane protein